MEKENAGAKKEMRLIVGSLLPSLALLKKNDPLRLAGATAFFTTFALPPIVFILAQLFGVFFGRKLVGRGLIQNIGNNLGDKGAEQVREVIRSIRGFSNNWFVIVPGFLFLIIVATTLFIVIKNSLDQIWQTKAREHAGFLFSLGERLRSFAVILLVGLLFFANLLFKSLEGIGGNYLENIFGGTGIYFKIVVSEVTSVVVVSAFFIMIFRFLADARPRWKAALIGGLLCGILFSGGRFLLRNLLINGNVGTMYGPSGSLVLVLLFVFYTSFIMYFGACFIAVYSGKKNWPPVRDHKAAKGERMEKGGWVSG